MVDPENKYHQPTIGRDGDLSEHSAEMISRAKVLRTEIEKLMALPKIGKINMDEAVANSGYSQSRVYDYLEAYRVSPVLTSLMPKKPSGGRGKGRINNAQGEIIQAVIQELYLTRNRIKPFMIIKEVNRRCFESNIDRPSPNTVRRRLKAIPARKKTANREGGKVARDKFQPVVGSFPEPEAPMDVVQFDHTPVDIIIVDEETGLSLGRPWLTIAYDVKTKALVGMHLSLQAPSALSVALCLLHASLPKAEWLAARGIDADWAMYGKPKKIHVDNGSDFRSEAFRTGCDQHGITIEYRPLGNPRFGGGVERAFRTLMTEIHQMPGTTFSNVADKRGYNSEKHASVTFKELERILAIFITKQYHERLHSTISMSPRRAWEKGIFGHGGRPGAGMPEIVKDPRRYLIDFLPFKRRKINAKGITWDIIFYNDKLLEPYIFDDSDKEYIVRRDPRDLSVVFLWSDYLNDYLEIPYANCTNFRITLWELLECRKRLKEQEIKHVDEALIFEGIAQIRESINNQVKVSKSNRVKHNKRLQNEKSIAARPTQKPKQPKPPKELDTPLQIKIPTLKNFDDIERW